MRYTGIHLPGLAGHGIMRHGLMSIQDMCDLIRATATRRKAARVDGNGHIDDEILSAADGDFHVETYWNRTQRREVKVLQHGRAIP